MDKLGFLKSILGDELYGKFMDKVGEKEGTAAVVGMVAKEVQETEKTETTTEKTEPVAIDLKALAEELGTKLQPLMDKVTAAEKAQEEGRKVAADALATFQTALDTRLKEVEKGVKEAKDGVAELRGDQSRAATKNRASQSDSTVTTKDVEGPAKDPDNEFFSFLFGGQK